MSTYKIGFYGEREKNIPELSSNLLPQSDLGIHYPYMPRNSFPHGVAQIY